jgi:hypothetical protein
VALFSLRSKSAHVIPSLLEVAFSGYQETKADSLYSI